MQARSTGRQNVPQVFVPILRCSYVSMIKTLFIYCFGRLCFFTWSCYVRSLFLSGKNNNNNITRAITSSNLIDGSAKFLQQIVEYESNEIIQ